MQIPKIFLAAGVLTLGLILAARAQDTPAQAAARAAVAAKLSAMSEMSPETNTVTIVPPPMETNSAMGAATELTNAPVVQKPFQMNSDISQNAPAMQTNSLPAAPMDLTISTNTPMTAPALPISLTKEQKLDALDAQYKADQISPAEYFKQRAAILNGQ